MPAVSNPNDNFLTTTNGQARTPKPLMNMWHIISARQLLNILTSIATSLLCTALFANPVVSSHLLSNISVQLLLLAAVASCVKTRAEHVFRYAFLLVTPLLTILLRALAIVEEDYIPVLLTWLDYSAALGVAFSLVLHASRFVTFRLSELPAKPDAAAPTVRACFSTGFSTLLSDMLQFAIFSFHPVLQHAETSPHATVSPHAVFAFGLIVATSFQTYPKLLSRVQTPPESPETTTASETAVQTIARTLASTVVACVAQSVISIAVIRHLVSLKNTRGYAYGRVSIGFAIAKALLLQRAARGAWSAWTKWEDGDGGWRWRLALSVAVLLAVLDVALACYFGLLAVDAKFLSLAGDG